MVEEDIGELEVTMDYTAFMHVLQTLQQLFDDFGRFPFPQRSVLLQQAVQVAPLAQFEDDVDVVVVGKVAIKADDAWGFHGGMNFDFLRDPIFHLVLGDGLLLHDL